MTPLASVVIPAHDEETVIGRCLQALLGTATPGELEVVVVANGCTDRTAAVARDVARDVAEGVVVVELDTASKIDALNVGDAAATGFPRVYLDADVEVTTDAIRTVVAFLDDHPELCCVAPRMELVLSDRPWPVRAFYRAFLDLPYAADALVGNGVYVLSRRGRDRFATFPDITADDLFVRNCFAPHERATVDAASFLVHPPRRLTGLLAIRERSYRGNAEYRARGYRSAAEPTRDRSRLAATFLRRPLDMAVYTAVSLTAMAKLRFRRRPVRWERDDSARRPSEVQRA